MGEQRYIAIAMLNGDHSKWKQIVVKGKSEEAARAKAEKKFSKITSTYQITDIILDS